MRHVHANLLILCCIVCISPSLLAAEIPLGIIPGDASFACRFPAPKQLVAKMDALLEPSQPKPQKAKTEDDDADVLVLSSWIPLLDQVEQFVPEADQQGDWWVFGSNVMQDPTFGVAIPATDPAALAKRLTEATKKQQSENTRNKKNDQSNDDQFATIVHENWVIYADPRIIDQVRECIAGKRKPMAGLLEQEAKLVFDQGDLGLFLNVPELAKEGDADWKTVIEAYFDSFGITINGQAGVQEFIKAIPGRLAAAIAQAIRDVNGFTVSLSLGEEDIRFENYIGVKPETPTAAFLRANPASTMEPLAGLPPSCGFYFGFHGNQKALTSLVTEIIKSGAEGSVPGFSPAHAEIRQAYEQLEYGTFAAAFPLWPLDRGPLRMLSITEVNDPQKARDLGLRSLELPPCALGALDPQKINKTIGAEKFGRHPADVITVPSSFAVNPLPVPGLDFDKLLFGPDGHVTRTVYLKDRIVEATGGTKLEMAAAVRRAADATVDGIKPEDQPPFLKIRNKLGEKSNLIVLLDLNSLAAAVYQAQIQMGFQLGLAAQQAEVVPENKADEDAPNVAPIAPVVPQAGLPPELQQFQLKMDSLKSSGALLGISLAFEPQASRLRVVIPVKSIQGVGKFFDPETMSPMELGEVVDMDGDEDAEEMAEAETQAEETPAEPEEKPAEVPEEKIVGDRKWKGKVREGKTLNPIVGADVLVKLSTTGDETTNETKTLREIALKTAENSTFEFTVTEEEANKPTLYIDFTIKSPEHVEYFGGYGYRLLLKNEKLGDHAFFEDIRMPRGRAIEGTLKTPKGEPAAGVKVIACTSPNFTNRNAQVRFPDTRTDENGHFRLVIFPQARAILWFLPQDYAIQTRPVRQNQEGNLGDFVLNPGPQISGKVLDAEGKPIAGIYVEADLTARPAPKEGKVPMVPEWVADQTHRATITAEDGSFKFRPLPPGDYEIVPSEKGWDPSTREGAVDPPRRPLPAVFLRTEVTLERGKKPELLEIRAIPHVTLEIQSMTSKGPKRGGPDLYLFGTFKGSSWQTSGEPSPQGTYQILAPKGLEDAHLSSITNEHTTIRFRKQKGSPLMEDRGLTLGKLTRDRKEMQVFSYKSPIVVITAETEDGDQIKAMDPKVMCARLEGKNLVGQHSVGVQNQGDGRFHTVQAPPNREMEITIEKEGFKKAQKKITLPEGKVEQVEFVLEKE